MDYYLLNLYFYLLIRFHTYCLNPPLPYVPDGSWYCTRCLPIVTSVESFSDSDNSNHGYSDPDHSSDDDDTMVTIKSVVQRKNGRISSCSSDNDDDSNFSSTDNEPTSSSLLSSQISSHDDVSSFITMTTDSDTPSESQQSSTSLSCVVTNSNNDSDIGSPHRENISSRIRITYSNIPTSSNDCLVTDDSKYDHKKWTISERSSHGDNIKRRLRNHSSVNNGHQLHMRRSSTDSLVRCILSVSDNEQTDTEYFPPYDSYPCSSSHAHIKMHQVKSSKETIQSYTIPLLPVSKSRGIKRHRKNRGRKGKNKRRRLPRRPLQHLMATPTTIQRRARTAATSPRLITTAAAAVTDSPQSVIRLLAKARYKTESLEEARRMSQIQSSSNRLTQNDIIARQVRAQQQQTSWWDSKVIDCYKSNTKVVCSPLKNAMRRHPLISSASLK